MNTLTYNSLEKIFFKEQDIDFSLDISYIGYEGIIEATWDLLKSLVKLVGDIFTAIKNILTKIYRWFEFKISNTSSNCRSISSKRKNKDYKANADRIVFDRGVPKDTLLAYFNTITDTIKLLDKIIKESNIDRQLDELIKLEPNDEGKYLRTVDCPLTEHKLGQLKTNLDALGVDLKVNKTQSLENSVIYEDCVVSNRNTFANNYNKSQTLQSLGYTLEDVLNIQNKEFKEAYNSIDTIHDYLSQLDGFRKRLDVLYSKCIKSNNPGDVSNTNHKVNRCKLLSKNLFICAQIYTTLLNILTEPVNYFTELTNILANAK